MHGAGPLPDPATPFGERVHRRLREEPIVRLSTVGPEGTPEPNPVWFLWEGETCLVYSTPAARRLWHARSRPAAALHFDRGDSGTIVMAARAWAHHFSVPLRIRLLRTRGHLAGG